MIISDYTVYPWIKRNNTQTSFGRRINVDSRTFGLIFVSTRCWRVLARNVQHLSDEGKITQKITYTLSEKSKKNMKEIKKIKKITFGFFRVIYPLASFIVCMSWLTKLMKTLVCVKYTLKCRRMSYSGQISSVLVRSEWIMNCYRSGEGYALVVLVRLIGSCGSCVTKI